MFQHGKIKETGLKILHISVRVSTLQEIRWHRQLQINKMYNDTLYFSGHLGTVVQDEGKQN